MTDSLDLDLRNCALILIKRRWMIFSILFLALTLAGIYNFMKVPLYRAPLTLQIERTRYTAVPEDIAGETQAEEFYQTQYNLLKSQAMARRVVERLKLTSASLNKLLGTSASIQEPAGSKDEITEALLSDVIEVMPLKNTSLFYIYAKTSDPELSKNIANAWAEEFINFSLLADSQYANVTEDLITQQIKQLQAEVVEKEKLLQNISIQQQVVRLDDNKSINSQSVEQINTALQSAKQETIALEVRSRNLRRTSPYAIPEIMNHPGILALKQQHNELVAEKSSMSNLFKPDYPEVLQLQAKIDQVDENLKTSIRDLYSDILSSAEAAHQQARNQERELENELSAARGQLITAGGKEVSYQQLKLEIDNKKSLLDTLLKTAGETGVSKAAKERKLTTIRIVDHAEIPKTRFEPKVFRNLLFAFLTALLSGICAALLLESMDKSYSEPAEVQQHLKLPVIGLVPHYHFNGNGRKRLLKKFVSDEKPKLKHHQDAIAFYDPQSPVSEAFTAIRTSFLLSFPACPPRTTVVTSSTEAEGKSFVACNFAISLAQLNKRVLLVDADMRNPRIQKILDSENHSGLSKFLTTNMLTSDIIFPSKVRNLSLITSGPRPPRPAELLASQRWDDLIQKLSEEYDHIVIDSPPLIPVADPVILISKAESVLIVIRGGVTSREIVQMAIQKLAHNESKIAGLVLNDLDMSGPYYYLRYRHAYSYKEKPIQEN
jgi:succinoglycan biosynthesis transport protein ExoP